LQENNEPSYFLSEAAGDGGMFFAIEKSKAFQILSDLEGRA
jgi:hypothetical protein